MSKASMQAVRRLAAASASKLPEHLCAKASCCGSSHEFCRRVSPQRASITLVAFNHVRKACEYTWAHARKSMCRCVDASLFALALARLQTLQMRATRVASSQRSPLMSCLVGLRLDFPAAGAQIATTRSRDTRRRGTDELTGESTPHFSQCGTSVEIECGAPPSSFEFGSHSLSLERPTRPGQLQ